MYKPPKTLCYPSVIMSIVLIIIILEIGVIKSEFDICSGRLLSEEVCLPKNYRKSSIPGKPPILVNMSLVIPNKHGVRNVNDNKMAIT